MALALSPLDVTGLYGLGTSHGDLIEALNIANGSGGNAELRHLLATVAFIRNLTADIAALRLQVDIAIAMSDDPDDNELDGEEGGSCEYCAEKPALTTVDKSDPNTGHVEYLDVCLECASAMGHPRRVQ